MDMILTEEEKAQARRDAGIVDFDPADLVEPESIDSEPEPNGEPADPVDVLRQKYLAGELDDEALDREVRKLAEQRVEPQPKPVSPEIDWVRLFHAFGVAIEAGVDSYKNYYR